MNESDEAIMRASHKLQISGLLCTHSRIRAGRTGYGVPSGFAAIAQTMGTLPKEISAFLSTDVYAAPLYCTK